MLSKTIVPNQSWGLSTVSSKRMVMSSPGHRMSNGSGSMYGVPVVIESPKPGSVVQPTVLKGPSILAIAESKSGMTPTCRG